MSMNLDKPLDDLISSNSRKGGRSGRGRGGRRGGGRAKAAALGGNKANAAAVSAAAAVAANRNKPLVIPGRGPGGQGSKIIVSNLPTDVTEAQVKELFSTTIGPLKRVSMSYRANGTSTGQVTIEFQRADDASRAYTQYNNRLIDGKKALRVEVVVDPARAAAAQAAVAGPAAAAGARAGQAAGAAAGRGAARGAGRGGRGGRGAGGRGGAARSAPRPKKTAEDLDAEMEDYASGKADGGAAPAATA